MNNEPLLQVKNLKKYFVKNEPFQAPKDIKVIDDISFEIGKGETLGIVGESGCGKSTMGRTILKLYEPTDGQIIYKGTDITTFSKKQMLPFRKSMQMIFQDPYASLNPRFTIGDIIEEPMIIHNLYTPKERMERVQEMLNIVGLKPDHIRRYPHEFSG
ncbi:MAG TPA: peptide ABC transporter ATP-binding protein, partial [Clostridium sp.]|nr:peptide ABC transporter ATP-binding protein [Clostridium sp.]